ncbi:TPA: dynamin family protein, partial [Mannheimia haemolytica]|nr:dynamin family protein [Mannheimia haemolytica]
MNNQKIEKQELIQNTKEFNIKIQELINKNDILDYLDFTSIKEKLEKHHSFLSKLEKDECEIAIVGLEKAGKSTFANALIESDIFPSAAERCTYTTTRLIYGEDKALVTFYTKSEFNSRFMKLLDLVKYP